MRISTLKSDRGYHPQAHLCKVFLDGEQVKDCVMADEEAGMVYCYKTDSKGNLTIDPNTGNTLQVVARQGKVQIVAPPGFRPVQNESIDIRGLVELAIRHEGGVGLYSTEECGCSVDDLAPCGEIGDCYMATCVTHCDIHGDFYGVGFEKGCPECEEGETY